MSNALAIGAVTAVLRDLLNNGLIDHDVTGSLGGNVTVSTLPPDRIPVGDGVEKSQLNLFLYQVTPNAGWRSAALPSRDGRGDRISNPPLALDLHYLLTAYGASEFHAEILLGYAMQLLHETPGLGRDAIRAALGAPLAVTGSVLPPAQQALVAAELADQIEQIKICPEAVSTEELSKLFTALTAHYRPSVSYQLSVVLIEIKRSTKSALPVRAANLKVFTWRQPVIESIVAQSGERDRLFEGSPVFVRGSQLRGDVTFVRFGDVEVTPPNDDDVQDAQINTALPAGLRAGVQSAQVIRRLNLGTASPDEPHRGFESNVAAFVLHPVIASPGPTPPAVTAPTAANVTPTLVNGAPVIVDGVTLQTADVTVNFAPRVGRSQRVTLFLNEANPPDTRPARAYTFAAPRDNGIVAPNQPDTASIVLPITFLAPGSYLVRVQVDGAESPLTTDNTGKFVSPVIAI